MSCLVIAELENGIPNRPSLAAISASLELESTIDLLVFNPDKIDEIKKIKNVKKIYSFKNKVDSEYKSLPDFSAHPVLCVYIKSYYIYPLSGASVFFSLGISFFFFSLPPGFGTAAEASPFSAAADFSASVFSGFSLIKT